MRSLFEDKAQTTSERGAYFLYVSTHWVAATQDSDKIRTPR